MKNLFFLFALLSASYLFATRHYFTPISLNTPVQDHGDEQNPPGAPRAKRPRLAGQINSAASSARSSVGTTIPMLIVGASNFLPSPSEDSDDEDSARDVEHIIAQVQRGEISEETAINDIQSILENLQGRFPRYIVNAPRLDLSGTLALADFKHALKKVIQFLKLIERARASRSANEQIDQQSKRHPDGHTLLDENDTFEITNNLDISRLESEPQNYFEDQDSDVQSPLDMNKWTPDCYNSTKY